MLKIKTLSKKDCGKIHSAGLDILHNVGVMVDNNIVYKLLCDAGAQALDEKNRVVRITEKMVEEGLARTPKKIALCGRGGGHKNVSAGSEGLFWAGNAMFLATGKERKLINSEEFVQLTRVMDSLENVHATVGTSINDYPSNTRDFVGFRLMAENTNKHLRPVIFTPTGVKVIIEMADVLLDGKPLADNPIFSLGYSIVSPLHWSETSLEMFINSAGHKIPIMINGEPLVGGTAPVTLAGSIALSNAEILSGIVIHQLIEPGRPCVYNLGFAHVFDMASCISLSASPECSLMAGACAGMAGYYGLPSASWMCTESMTTDEQSAYEKTMNGMTHLLSGINLIWGVGQLESQLTMSLEQAVIDDEIIGQLRRLQKGFKVNDETIAMDIIKDVGLKGDFLSHEHTLQNFKKEITYPKLLFRNKRDFWENSGKKNIQERAEEKVKEILFAKKQEYLTDSQKEKLKSIENKWIERMR